MVFLWDVSTEIGVRNCKKFVYTKQGVQKLRRNCKKFVYTDQGVQKTSGNNNFRNSFFKDILQICSMKKTKNKFVASYSHI